MQLIAIIGLCVLSAVVYGIVHDMVTVRICLEYFTLFHPDLFHTQSPTLLALGWGVVATWWVGLILGVPLALVARVGSWPKLSARDLLAPIAKLLFAMAGFAAIAGMYGYLLFSRGRIPWISDYADGIAPARYQVFATDLFAHTASYAVGFLGGVVLCVVVLVMQWKKIVADHS